MNKLRLLIVDDEPLIRRGLRNSASEIENVEVIGEAGSGSEAVEAIDALKPDVVLLDVQMPDCSGLSVIRQVGVERMPLVIFVTAFDEYAVKAFELNAVDYLLKPFDTARLRESLARARQRLEVPNREDLVEQLRKLLPSNPAGTPDRLVVRNGERYEFVPVDAIDWIESANNYVELYCGPKQYLMSETLTNLESRLDPAKFRRIHRCRIVNTSRVQAIYSLLNGAYEIELRNGQRLTSGRQFRHVVQQLLANES